MKIPIRNMDASLYIREQAADSRKRVAAKRFLATKGHDPEATENLSTKSLVRLCQREVRK